MAEKAVQKPQAPKGINKPQEEPAKASANELLNKFLLENNLVLMLDTLDLNIQTVSDGSIIVGKPRITAKYKNA